MIRLKQFYPLLQRGATVTLVRSASGWALVQYGSKTGWVSQEYLKIDPGTNQFERGDVNMDGRVTAGDARLALRYSAKMETFTEQQVALADFNEDGRVTAGDARNIMRLSAKILVN